MCPDVRVRCLAERCPPLQLPSDTILLPTNLSKSRLHSVLADKDTEGPNMFSLRQKTCILCREVENTTNKARAVRCGGRSLVLLVYRSVWESPPLRH